MNETTLRPLRIEWEDSVYQDWIRTIRPARAYFDGFTKDYLVGDYGQRAAVLVIADGHILMTRQYRLLIDDVSFEIPGGRIDEGETPAQAAARECFEETGVTCSGLKALVGFLVGMDILDNRSHVFQANFEAGGPMVSSDRHTWLPFAVCERLLVQGAIQDSMTMIALFAFFHNRGRSIEIQGGNVA
jgi:ADP-ribose pyrophosphatase